MRGLVLFSLALGAGCASAQQQRRAGPALVARVAPTVDAAGVGVTCTQNDDCSLLGLGNCLVANGMQTGLCSAATNIGGNPNNGGGAVGGTGTGTTGGTGTGTTGGTNNGGGVLGNPQQLGNNAGALLGSLLGGFNNGAGGAGGLGGLGGLLGGNRGNGGAGVNGGGVGVNGGGVNGGGVNGGAGVNGGGINGGGINGGGINGGGINGGGINGGGINGGAGVNGGNGVVGV